MPALLSILFKSDALCRGVILTRMTYQGTAKASVSVTLVPIHAPFRAVSSLHISFLTLQCKQSETQLSDNMVRVA